MPERAENDQTAALIKELIAEAFAPFTARLTQQEERITEKLETVLSSIASTTTEAPAPRFCSPSAPTDGEGKESRGQHRAFDHYDDASEEQGASLARAYQELQTQGERISGRALAARVHVRRSTCNRWLAAYHPDVTHEEPEEEPEHGPM